MGCRIIMCTIIMSEELDGETKGRTRGFVVSMHGGGVLEYWMSWIIRLGVGSAYSIDRPVLRPGSDRSDLYIIDIVYLIQSPSYLQVWRRI